MKDIFQSKKSQLPFRYLRIFEREE